VTGALTVVPVRGLPEVSTGDDLAAMIAAHAELEPGDVVVVAQKVVSKAEGAVVAADPHEDPRDARRRLARSLARRIVADTPWVLVTETPHGLVCANGGIDASNTPDGTYVLLPDDPDASARRIREGLRTSLGFDVPVVVTDTFGRPWRIGQTDVAIGLSGLAAVRDERGDTDRHGMVLDVTEAAVADELAAAADLVRRKGDGVPVVVVRGFAWTPDESSGVRDLVRPSGEDLFRRGSGLLALELAGGAEPAGASATPGARLPLHDSDVDVARRIAARADGKVTTERAETSTTLVVEGDRLAAGLVLAALQDLGCTVDWTDGEAGVVIEASRDHPERP
jgi:coenzyme F420-0:L-glutamate ligase / coenzyme F420-1:gamma-L-glutamate ligase